MYVLIYSTLLHALFISLSQSFLVGTASYEANFAIISNPVLIFTKVTFSPAGFQLMQDKKNFIFSFPPPYFWMKNGTENILKTYSETVKPSQYPRALVFLKPIVVLVLTSQH